MHKTITSRTVYFNLEVGLPFWCVFVTIYVILRQNVVQITALMVASPLIAVFIRRRIEMCSKLQANNNCYEEVINTADIY